MILVRCYQKDMTFYKTTENNNFPRLHKHISLSVFGAGLILIKRILHKKLKALVHTFIEVGMAISEMR